MATIGFILLTHSEPAQIRRLLTALNHLYGNPPVVIHHDWDRCSLGGFEEFGNVTFVRPHIATSWGAFNLVEAMLAALRTFSRLPAAPEWVTVLSGADYPTKAAPEVLRELEDTGADICLDYEEIDPRNPRREWHSECVTRYFRFYLPVPRRTPHGFRVTHQPARNPHLLWLLSPYSRKFRCYAGSQWFSARSHVARKIVDWHDRNPWFGQHLDERWCTDETFFQTVVCNLPGLRLSQGHRRYVDWSERAAHPKQLGLDDIPAITASGAHFARKFAPHDAVLDHLDRMLGIPSH